MQIRSLAAIAAIGVVVAGGLAPAVAAPKAKPVTGSYTLTLTPDPSPNAFNNVPGAQKSCENLNPASRDDRTVKLPRAGRLQIVLDSAQSTPAADWDLYAIDAKTGEVVAESASEFSKEEISLKLKKASDITISVCNLAGEPQAKVSYTLT